MDGMAELTLLLFFAFVEDTVAKAGGSSGGRSGGRSGSLSNNSRNDDDSDGLATCNVTCVIVLFTILGAVVLLCSGCCHSFWRSVKKITRERFEIASAVENSRANQWDNIKPTSVPPQLVPPSGPWICKYSDASHRADVASSCEVQFFNDGRMTGTGTDPDGTYTMEGHYNHLTKLCQWTQQQTKSKLACELSGSGYSANPEVAFHQITGAYLANTGFHGPFTLLYNGQCPPATAGPQDLIPAPGYPPQASPQVVSPPGAIPPDSPNGPQDIIPQYPPHGMASSFPPAADSGTPQIELSEKSKWKAVYAATNTAEAFQSVTMSEYTKFKSLPSSNKRGEVEVHWEVYARLKWKVRQLLGKR